MKPLKWENPRVSNRELMNFLCAFRRDHPIRWVICRVAWGFDPRRDLDRYRRFNMGIR